VQVDEEHPVPPPAARRSLLPGIILALALIVGALFRVNGLDWDDGKFLHPDELHITDVIANRIHAPDLGLLFDADRSPLNPRSVDPRAYEPRPEGSAGVAPRPRQFAYGSLPLFATDLVGWLWSQLTRKNWNQFWEIFRVGRAMTVLADLTTIGLTFGLARRAYGTRAGLLAAAFLALATMPVQLAHFFVTDTWTTTFITATLWATLVATRRATPRAFALAGFLAGCAMATKATVVIVVIPLVVAAWLAATRAHDAALHGPTSHDMAPYAGSARRFLGGLLAAGGAAFVAFLIFEPYAVLNPLIYIRDIGEQSAIIGGKVDVPYTRQYIGTIPLVYQAKSLVGWGLGPLLGGAVLAGFAQTLWRGYRRRATTDLVLLAWVLPYLLLLALNEAKFLRYLLPVLPVFLAFAAKLLLDLGAFARQTAAPSGAMNGHAPLSPLPRWRTRGATTLATLILAGTFLTTLAFSAIYSRPHTQVAASEWIYANIPEGSAISHEYWDHPLPLPLDNGRDPGFYSYKPIVFDFYNDTPACDRSDGKTPPPQACTPNNAATLDYFIGKLDQVEYLIEGTNRIYGSVTRTPWRSPIQQQFFELLFAGRLGFERVYDNPSFPTLGGVQFDDSFMDESFTVYDHPRVMIFKKTRELSRDELRALFAPALERPLSPTRYPRGATEKPLLLAQLVDRLPAVTDLSWNRAIGSNGVAATLLWLLTIELLGLLALPLTLRLFARFPDRGWGLSKLIGWLLLAYPVWLAASLRLGRFSLPALLVALGIGAALAAGAAYRWRAHYRATLRGAWPTIAWSEGIFLLIGGVFLGLRLRNPDLWHPYWGGEKPMELTHLNGILRSANFPPLDPWFADGTINYYYYGQYLVAALIKLTGIPVEIAFNLAMPTVSALLATAAFSVAAALAALALRRRASRWAIGGFGTLGTLLFVGVGNLDGAARLIGRARDGATGPLGFDYFWGGSRTIDGAITEFPFFTQLWADLHAHAIALPFTLLIVGLVVSLIGQGDSASARGHGPRRTIRALAPTLAMLALTVGAVACINSWDVPIYLLVTGAGLIHALAAFERRAGPPDLPTIGRRLALAAGGTLATGVAAYALYYPFFSHFKALVGSLARTRVPTPLPQFLDHFGLFMALILIVLLAGFATYLPRPQKRPILLTGLALAFIGAAVAARATALTAWVAQHSAIFGGNPPLPPPDKAISGLTPAFLTVFLILLITFWALAWGETRLQVPLVLLIAGVGVTLGPELIFVADDLQGGDWERMNTVFKFYMHGWTLFALGGVGALAWLWETAPRWSLAPFRHWGGRLDRRFNAATLRGLVAGLLALLLCASFVYPFVATPIRLAERFPVPATLGPTLNGYRWMEYGQVWNESPNDQCGGPLSFRDDYAAINWLNDTVIGTPVIAEASIGPYRGNGSRFAIATGLPTILGWDRHEYQQRPAEGIFPRSDDVRTLYDSTDQGRKLAVLQRYHVSYVVVGALERGWYVAPANRQGCADPYASRAGLATLEGMVGTYLAPAFRSGDTTIYRVLPAAFSSGVAAGDPAAPGRGAQRPAPTGGQTSP